MTIEEMRSKKAELGLTNQELSRISGIPFSTVQKVFSGTTSSPRMNTILALEEGFAIAERNHRIYPSLPNDPGSGMFSEEAIGYFSKKQGDYTLDDYYAIPDERRVELIDGVIYDMGSPSVRHQIILGEMYLQFRVCLENHKEDCTVMLSPCDVRLDNDNKTIVQPDLFIICSGLDVDLRHFSGAPDLTVEILSPSTRSRDMLLKSYKYQNAGVREYWIVDPANEEVIVYDFTDKNLPFRKFSFSDRIPVLISAGKCVIDFPKIKKALK